MNEKMRVLELLEAGKITADEAAKLLEVLGGSRLMSKETRENVEEKLHQFAHDVGKFCKETGCKVKELYKDVEPKLKKASQSALEKAAAALDSLAHNISDSIEKSKTEACCCSDSSCCCAPCDEDAPKPN